MENKKKKIEDLKNLIKDNPMTKEDILDRYPLSLLSDNAYGINPNNKKFNNNDMNLYLGVINQIDNDKKRADDMSLFHNLDKTYNNIKDDMLKDYDPMMKDLIINHQLVENTLTNFIILLGEKKYIDDKVENLIELYIDKLEDDEMPEDIIRYELDLPEKGNRDTWMNLITGIIELSKGKPENFINESNKVLKLYKKEK